MSRSQDVVIALRRILRAAEMAARDLTERTGLTPSQMVVLQIIARTGNPSAGAVAEAAQLSQATVTAVCDRLEENGFVLRSRDAEDRRRVLLQATPKAHEVIANTPDVLQNRFVRRFEGLKDWEQAAIVATLERTATLLDDDQTDDVPISQPGRIDPGLGD